MVIYILLQQLLYATVTTIIYHHNCYISMELNHYNSYIMITKIVTHSLRYHNSNYCNYDSYILTIVI